MLVLTACFDAPAIVVQGTATGDFWAHAVPMFSEFGGEQSRYCKVLCVPGCDQDAVKMLRRGLASGGLSHLLEGRISALLLPIADAAGRGFSATPS